VCGMPEKGLSSSRASEALGRLHSWERETLEAGWLCPSELWRSPETDALLGGISCPSYSHKGAVYNAWLMGVSTSYLWTKLLLAGS
jgi:hypothetical protein